MSMLARLLPNLVSVSPLERLRAGSGAFFGIVLTAAVTALVVGPVQVPLLMAPIGASAVLLFAVPASPLAQPWSILGGNLVASLVGVTAAMLVPYPPLASALALGVSIALMLTLKCLHPPSGAVALTAVIGGPAITGLGYGFVLWPVGINSLVLLAVAIIFNRATGKRYPHKAAVAESKMVPLSPTVNLGISVDDLTQAIRERDEVVSVDPNDLEDMLERAALVAFERRSGGVTAGAVMSRMVEQVQPDTSLRLALRTLREHGVKAVPVVDGAARVVGILTQTDLLEKAEWGPMDARHFGAKDRPLRGKVRDVMTADVASVRDETPIGMVIRAMLDGGHHHLPVVDAEGRLVGMVTQSDVIAALFGV